ncbi:MAG: hypothetical protein F6K09_39505 [Merismopedia sp. SIO2A8]|nr:hypothetical protein [Merismopedia sp. SIO2A8]
MRRPSPPKAVAFYLIKLAIASSPPKLYYPSSLTRLAIALHPPLKTRSPLFTKTRSPLLHQHAIASSFSL